MVNKLTVCVLLGVLGWACGQIPPPGWPCSVPFPCVPEQTYGHPRNCSLFYLCGFAEEIPFVLMCSTGTVYNPQRRVCDYPENTVCEPDCTAPIKPPNWPCNIPYPCVHEEQYGIPSDCSKYFICIRNDTAGKIYLESGQCVNPTPRWDSRSRRCERETTAVCEPDCTTTSAPTTTAKTKPATATEGFTDGGFTDGGFTDVGFTDDGFTDGGFTDGFTGIVPGTGVPRPTDFRLDDDLVAFSATLTLGMVHLSRGQHVPFNHVDIDSQRAFKSSRGSFICPHDGTKLYSLSVHIRFRGKMGGRVSVLKTKKNRRTILARLMAAKRDVTASRTMVVNCQKGEEIRVICSSRRCDIIGQKFTSWTIYMLK